LGKRKVCFGMAAAVVASRHEVERALTAARDQLRVIIQ
jgi:hypothetical protein